MRDDYHLPPPHPLEFPLRLMTKEEIPIDLISRADQHFKTHQYYIFRYVLTLSGLVNNLIIDTSIVP